VLLASVGERCRTASVGIVLTGMGDDGADGLLRLRRAGGVTIAQDEESSVVFGMPKQAIALGAAEHVLPPAAIAAMVRAMTS
jgi:two-component system, chemotaxis family, protein-glutamate methylesterase/glutaminase